MENIVKITTDTKPLISAFEKAGEGAAECLYKTLFAPAELFDKYAGSYDICNIGKTAVFGLNYVGAQLGALFLCATSPLSLVAIFAVPTIYGAIKGPSEERLQALEAQAASQIDLVC